MAVPYTFASAAAPIPLNELDANFSTPIVLGNTTIQLGNTVSTVVNISLDSPSISNVAISSGTADLTAGSVLTTFTGCYGTGGILTNLAIGATIPSNSTGNQMTAVGQETLNSNISGNSQTAIGYRSQYYSSSNANTTSVGTYSMYFCSTGSNNTAIGSNAQYGTTGNSYSYCTSVGAYSMWKPTTGNYNSAFGSESMYAITSGSNNLALGRQSAYGLTTGSGNIMVGGITSGNVYSPVFALVTESNRLVMGSTAVTNAYVQVAWTVVSDARDKTNFAPVPYGLDFVSKLEPTSYQFTVSREDPTPVGIVRYGFKAQDIMALEGDNPVIIDAEDPEKLKFNSDSLIPVLVNAIKELKTELDLLKLKVGA